jgi:hypothetical protein
MTMFMPGLRHFPRPVLAWLGLATSTADGATQNFGNFNAPRAGLMIVGTWGRHTDGAGRTISSVDIGGSGGTIHVNPAGASNPVCIASRLVAPGNQNVTVGFSAIVQRAAAAVWLLTHHASAAPVDVDGTNNGANATSIAATLDLKKNGIAVFMNFHNNDTAAYSSAVDATTPVSVEGGSIVQPGHILLTPEAAAHVETIAWAGSRACSIAAASWR